MWIYKPPESYLYYEQYVIIEGTLHCVALLYRVGQMQEGKEARF